MDATFDPLGTCRSADDLRQILRTRLAELGISFETCDHIAGLPTRYTAKVLGFQATRGFGQISLDALLGAAGVMLIAVPDPDAIERIRNRLRPLERIDTSGGVQRRVKFNFTIEFMRKIGQLGGMKSAAIAKRKRARSEIYRRNGLKAAEKAAQRKTEGTPSHVAERSV